MTLYRDIPDKATLEREYSPSSCAEDFPAILAEYAARSRAARAAKPLATLSYGAHPAETLDLFRAPGGEAAPTPTVIYIHGGYWQELSKDEHSFPAPALHRHGCNYVAINYGLAPDATLAEMIGRCRAAVRWLAAEAGPLGLDAARFHLVGCSAGAHLAAMVALAGQPLRSLTLMSGVFDLRPIPLTYINDAVGMTEEEALRFSPLLLADAAAAVLPATCVVWGEHETGEFKRQSRAFAAAVARRGTAVTMREIAGRNHFDLIFDLGDATSEFGALLPFLTAREVSE